MTILLDITRTVSRMNQGLVTGVDRVELAYIDEISRKSPDALFLVALGGNFALLTITQFRTLCDTKTLPPPKGVDWLRFRLSFEQRKLRSEIRRIAEIFGVWKDLPNVLRQKFPTGFDYYNVAHSNLNQHNFDFIKRAECHQIHVFVHDMIPLDYPQYCRADTPEKFQNKMRVVAQYADRIIVNSQDTKSAVEKHFSSWGTVPEICVAKLGLHPVKPDYNAPISHGDKPYFVILGTIEPRKNHTVLFDAWQELFDHLAPEQIPNLLIIGRRGWSNASVFEFLDHSPLMGRHVFELGWVDDDETAGYIQHANAVLFPSFIEGYGLPAVEAMRQKTPLICSDLNVFRECVGDYPTYVDPKMASNWCDAIISHLESNVKQEKLRAKELKLLNESTWSAHFDKVFAPEFPQSSTKLGRS